MFLRRLFHLPLPRLLRSRKTAHRRGVIGAVMVEYAFLLVAVGIPALAGLTAGGVHLYNGYKQGRDAMLSPFP